MLLFHAIVYIVCGYAYCSFAYSLIMFKYRHETIGTVRRDRLCQRGTYATPYYDTIYYTIIIVMIVFVIIICLIIIVIVISITCAYIYIYIYICVCSDWAGRIKSMYIGYQVYA